MLSTDIIHRSASRYAIFSSIPAGIRQAVFAGLPWTLLHECYKTPSRLLYLLDGMPPVLLNTGPFLDLLTRYFPWP